MRSMHSKRFAPLLGLGLLAVTSTGRAAEVSGYNFPAAAQEITQLFWLAETANICGWTRPEDAVKFKLFAMRFLGAHLSDANREALASLVLAKGYEERVRRVAARLARGEPLDQALWQERALSPAHCIAAQVGGQTGQLAEALEESAARAAAIEPLRHNLELRGLSALAILIALVGVTLFTSIKLIPAFRRILAAESRASAAPMAPLLRSNRGRGRETPTT